MAVVAKALPVTPAPRVPPVVRAGVAATPARVVSIDALRIHCQTCSIRELCLPVGMTGNEMERLDNLVTHRIRIRKGETLYRAGQRFHSLYAIRAGSLKTTVIAEDGREQVMSYHLPAEIVGFDGIGVDAHTVETFALEDTEVCALPFDRIEELAQAMPRMQHNLLQLMSKEMMRDQRAMLMLGSMRAEERLALFLLGLSDRYHRLGYSATAYTLRLTRAEIGSCIGLTLETVSRIFSRFHAEGLIHVQGRSVKLLDPIRLKSILGRGA
jgi:CRP/FNR family transcriptional regulator